MSYKIRVTMSDEEADLLKAHAAASGRTENDLLVAGYLEYRRACLAILGPGVAISGPADRPNLDQPEQTYEPPRLGRTTGKPKRDYMATDSDEIRALIDEYNSLPDPFATTDEDVMLIRSKTAAEVWKRVQRLRHPELTVAK